MGKKTEECHLCGEEKDCVEGCGCSKCIFPSKYSEWIEDNPALYKFYLKSNERFYDLLFEKSKEFENRWTWHFVFNLRNLKQNEELICQLNFILYQFIKEFD